MTRKQRVTRVVYAVYVVLVTAFVASSIAQVARRVFGEPDHATAAVSIGDGCARVLTDEIDAIDAARSSASAENGAEAARSRYHAARPSREPIALASTRCRSDAQGAAALAALAKFDRAAEADAVRAAAELSPVRLEAQSFIRGHTR
jgi:hypothetical protein